MTAQIQVNRRCGTAGGAALAVLTLVVAFAAALDKLATSRRSRPEGQVHRLIFIVYLPERIIDDAVLLLGKVWRVLSDRVEAAEGWCPFWWVERPAVAAQLKAGDWAVRKVDFGWMSRCNFYRPSYSDQIVQYSFSTQVNDRGMY